ncbi:MAG: hypothetical protein ACREI6_07900 [Candidatus Rokuibacteriota bacterium]
MTAPPLRAIRDTRLAALAGVALSAALVDAASLRQPVLLLLIAASALGFRLGARR